MKHYDVIVIGAGPAGAASALFLEGQGYKVALLDRGRFPRDKVCGEFISPAADALLQKIGVLAAVEALNPMRLQGVVLSAHESAQVTIDYPLSSEGGSMSSLSLPRHELDALLVTQAKSRGITVLEEHQVTDFVFSGDRVAGVEGRDAANVVVAAVGGRVGGAGASRRPASQPGRQATRHHPRARRARPQGRRPGRAAGVGASRGWGRS